MLEQAGFDSPPTLWQLQQTPEPETTMYQSYEEACEATVTAAQACREVERHGLSFADFQSECGVAEMYRGEMVLDWLGY